MHPYPDFWPSSSSSENDFYGSKDNTTEHTMFRWKSGKRVNPKIQSLLESFGEIYVERHEFFDKIFHGEHEELFKKIGHVLKKKKQMKKSGSIKRSMSMRTVRQRGVVFEESEDGLRNERFKVRTPNVIVAVEDDGLAGAQVHSNDSK